MHTACWRDASAPRQAQTQPGAWGSLVGAAGSGALRSELVVVTLRSVGLERADDLGRLGGLLEAEEDEAHDQNEHDDRDRERDADLTSKMGAHKSREQPGAGTRGERAEGTGRA
jgi:hypothetical protein